MVSFNETHKSRGYAHKILGHDEENQLAVLKWLKITSMLDRSSFWGRNTNFIRREKVASDFR